MLRYMKKMYIACLIPALISVIFFIFVPIVKIVNDSFFSFNLLSKSRKFVGMENYIEAFKDPVSTIAIKNTVVYVIVTVIFGLIIGFVLALILNREFKGNKFFSAVLLFPLVIPQVVSGAVFKFIFNDQYGLINHIGSLFGLPKLIWLASPNLSWLVVLVVGVWVTFPFFMILILAGLQAIPTAILEAAEVDGVNLWQKLIYIIIPQLYPVLTVALAIQIINSVRVFDTVYVLTGGGPGGMTETISTYAYKQTFEFMHVGYGSALGVIITVIAILLSLPFFKSLIQQKA